MKFVIEIFNFGFGIGHSEDDGCLSHLSEELGLERASCRDSNEDIGSNEGFLEGTLLCIVGELFFLGVHSLSSASKDNTFRITDDYVLFENTIVGHEAETGNTGSTSTVKNNLDGRNIFSSNLNCVNESR